MTHRERPAPGIYDTGAIMNPVQMTARLAEDLHRRLGEMSNRTGKSMNRLLNEAAEMAMSPPGGAAMISEERKRQLARFTAQYDDRHDRSELAKAGLAYVLEYLGWHDAAMSEFPWKPEEFRPGSTPQETLARAGALLAAEIDRTSGGI